MNSWKNKFSSAKTENGLYSFGLNINRFYYLQLCAMALVLLLIYLVTDMYEGKSKMTISLNSDVREGRSVCTRLAPGYRGAAADVEQILLRWEILGREVVQARQVKISLCRVKTRIIFCSARYNEDYIAPN